MKNLKNNLSKVGIYISIAIFGYIFARYFNVPHFEVSKTVDISNILSLLMTAWIAILISTVFEKKNGDNRIEKDLIIGRVGNMYDIAATLQIESNTGSIHLTEANSSLKRINTSLSSVYKIVEKCHFSISDEIKEKIKTCIAELKEMLTNTPALPAQLNNPQVPIEIRENIVYYNQDRMAQIGVKFDLLKDLLLELQIEINGK